MPGDPVSRAPGRLSGRAERRRPWLSRLRDELGSISLEHDPVIRLIIVERLVKCAVLLVLAVSLVAADRMGYLPVWASWAQDQLNLSAGRGVIVRVLTWAVEQLGHLLPHVTIVSLAIVVYAALEGTEGVGLAMRRRWAEYLTVLATAVFIPFEVLEVVHRLTAFRVGALLVNVAIVVYLAYRKRLFVDV